jgi:K+-transporting ATPase ATPase B chain
MVVLVALLVCLIPTTIGALLSAIGIAGMDRLVQRNVLAMSGRAVEAAGDVSTLLLDKTGTITLGNRQAASSCRWPVAGVTKAEVADAAQLSSLADETPEGRSIVVLAKEEYGLRERHQGELVGAEWIAFTAQTRMSGVDVDGRKIRKGAAGSVIARVRERGGAVAEDADAISNRISEAGGTPLLVAVEDSDGARILGVIHLKDVVKEGMRERFEELRRMGIKTVTQYKLILSGATNRSADNPELIKWVEEAKAKVVKENSTADHKVEPSQVPADAVTSSGSGLDPDISPAYAELQVHRVAERNGLPVAQVEKLIEDHTEGRTLGFIGEPRVNVLELNIALKELVAHP